MNHICIFYTYQVFPPSSHKISMLPCYRKLVVLAHRGSPGSAVPKKIRFLIKNTSPSPFPITIPIPPNKKKGRKKCPVFSPKIAKNYSLPLAMIGRVIPGASGRTAPVGNAPPGTVGWTGERMSQISHW